jgi:hypothetical protein
MKALSVISAVIAVAVMVAAPAIGDGPPVGSACVSSQVNTTTTSNTGTTVRCLADEQRGYIWMVDTGQTQDPWVADQIAWAACHQQGHTDAECPAILDGS